MRLCTWLVAICLLAIIVPHTPAAAQSGPQFDRLIAVPDSADSKFPQVTLAGDQVVVASNRMRSEAAFWTRAAAEDQFSAPAGLGAAEGQPDYSTAAIAGGSDGKLYAAWINQSQRSIYLRVRGLGGVWGPTTTVVRGSPFPVMVQVVTANDGSVFVIWRDPDRPFRFSRSIDGGNSWSAAQPISDQIGFNTATLASAANTTGLAFTSDEANRLQIFAGAWNGAGFTTRRISQLSGDFADPSVAVSPQGGLAVAWRGIEERGSASGVFLAEQSSDGAWPTSRLIEGKVIGRVNVAYDQRGGLHVLWIAETSGSMQLWYAYRAQGGAWQGPSASSAPGLIFNAHAAAGYSSDGSLYAHAVSERFIGDRVYQQAYRFRADSDPLPYARPEPADGNRQVATPQLTIAFRDVRGEPSELNWSWNSIPNNTAWQPFSEQISVPLPSGAGLKACDQHTFYAQVRGAGGTQNSPTSTQIVVDRAVQATVAVAGSASAPGYTNQPSAYLHIDSAAECSGLQTGALNGTPIGQLSSSDLYLPVSIPAVEQTHMLSLQLTDGMQNRRSFELPLTYDITPPELAGSPLLEVQADPQASVINTLRISGGRYLDNASTTPWAVELLVTLDDGSPFLIGRSTQIVLPSAAITRAADGQVQIEFAINLNSALGVRALPGTYHFQVRLIDPAGNRNAEALDAHLLIEQISEPTLYLPTMMN